MLHIDVREAIPHRFWRSCSLCSPLLLMIMFRTDEHESRPPDAQQPKARIYGFSQVPAAALVEGHTRQVPRRTESNRQCQWSLRWTIGSASPHFSAFIPRTTSFCLLFLSFQNTHVRSRTGDDLIRDIRKVEAIPRSRFPVQSGRDAEDPPKACSLILQRSHLIMDENQEHKHGEGQAKSTGHRR